MGIGKPRSVRTHLVVFGAAVALPLVALLGVMLLRGARLERVQLERQMLQVASNVSDDVDREINCRLRFSVHTGVLRPSPWFDETGGDFGG